MVAEQRENLMRAIFHQAPVFMAVLRGKDFVFEMVNDAYYELIGRREIIGRPLVEALPEMEGQGFIEILHGVARTGEPFIGTAVPMLLSRNRDEEPERRYVDFVYHLIPGGDPESPGIIAHGSDVTGYVMSREEATRLLADSEQARADAEGARLEAQVANSAKVDFLRKMSHELRTPLNAIAGYTALIEMEIHGPVTDAQRDDLERIRMSQQHLLGLINGVLSFAKLESGSMEFAIEAREVAGDVREATAIVLPQVLAAGLELTLHPIPDGLQVLADPDRLRQILLNLLSNATKFTRPGGCIEVSAAGEKTDVVVRVADSGIGIVSDHAETIFQPFFQVRSDLARTHEGTGLGLSISRELARGMGGELTVESRPGEGSTFSLRLPMVG